MVDGDEVLSERGPPLFMERTGKTSEGFKNSEVQEQGSCVKGTTAAGFLRFKVCRQARRRGKIEVQLRGRQL